MSLLTKILIVLLLARGLHGYVLTCDASKGAARRARCFADCQCDADGYVVSKPQHLCITCSDICACGGPPVRGSPPCVRCLVSNSSTYYNSTTSLNTTTP